MNILKHNRKRVFLPAILSVFTLIPARYTLSPVFAAGPGSAGVQILKTDMSPRAMGMGGSFVAIADDIYAVNYNPAGIGRLDAPEASATYFSGMEDSQLQHLAFGAPLPVDGLAGLENPRLAVSAILSQSGRFTYRLINPGGTVSETSMDADNTRVFALTYGEKVYSADTKIDRYTAKFEQYLGLSAKYIRSELLTDIPLPLSLLTRAG
jgi:hypothetical protein